MPKRVDGLIRAFGMSGIQIVTNLSDIEAQHSIQVGHTQKNRKISDYKQFEASLRAEAARMSELYEIFYCLENSIRRLVMEAMEESSEGANWWDSELVSTGIRNEVKSRQKKETESVATIRSEDPIDYTTFGELSQLITDNWILFEPVFQSKKAVSTLMNQLNTLRGPIAHCNPTNEIEYDRLKLAVRSWFDLMS